MTEGNVLGILLTLVGLASVLVPIFTAAIGMWKEKSPEFIGRLVRLLYGACAFLGVLLFGVGLQQNDLDVLLIVLGCVIIATFSAIYLVGLLRMLDGLSRTWKMLTIVYGISIAAIIVLYGALCAHFNEGFVYGLALAWALSIPIAMCVLVVYAHATQSINEIPHVFYIVTAICLAVWNGLIWVIIASEDQTYDGDTTALIIILMLMLLVLVGSSILYFCAKGRSESESESKAHADDIARLLQSFGKNVNTQDKNRAIDYPTYS